jgi:hypothetical protein
LLFFPNKIALKFWKKDVTDQYSSSKIINPVYTRLRVLGKGSIRSRWRNVGGMGFVVHGLLSVSEVFGLVARRSEFVSMGGFSFARLNTSILKGRVVFEIGTDVAQQFAREILNRGENAASDGGEDGGT